MDVESEPQIRVKFITKFEQYKVPTTPIAVPIRFSRYGLSEVINHLLDLSTPQPFDFIINGKFLRVVLSQFIAEHDISLENVLTLEYVPIINKPEEKSSTSFPDWISSIDVKDDFYTVAGFDGSVTVFDHDDKQLTKTRIHKMPIKSVTSCKINDMYYTITGSLDTRIKICGININSKENSKMSLLNTIIGHNSSISAVSMSKDNTLLASGAWNGSLNIWKFNQLIDIEKKEEERNIPVNTITGHNENISSIEWINNNTILSSSWDHSVRTWDLETEGVINTYVTNKVVTKATYNDRNQLIITAHPDGIVRLFDNRDKSDSIMKMHFNQSGNWMTSIAWQPMNDYIFITGSHDGIIRLWDIRSATPTYILDTIHTNKIFDIQWKDSNTILSGGEDKELKRSIIP